MTKSEYGVKLSNLFMDKEFYVTSTTSDFQKLVNSINKMVDKLRKAKALTRREALATKATDAAMARFYGLSKVHKPGVPLRPIVSLRGTPTFGLSKLLYQRLCFLTEDSKWTVKSADEFLTRIKHLEEEADKMMVSFDVISLFTSIPPALAIDTIDGFLQEKYDETDQKLKRAHIIELLELCLQTFFTFNGQVYEQNKGTPLGSSLSGLIAEAVLQRLEQLVFSSYPPKFWARYVDDTFVIIKRSHVQAFRALLNSIFPDIQFAMEEEVNNQLPFFDVQPKTDGTFHTSVYRKEAYAEVILHYQNNHPVAHKRNTVNTLLNRAKTHCFDKGQTGRMLGSRIHEHKLAVRRGDGLLQLAAHTYETGHDFNFAATKIITHARCKTSRELIEAWASDENSVNRFIDLAPPYRTLRSYLWTKKPLVSDWPLPPPINVTNLCCCFISDDGLQ
ncbi:unnamed protein product [Schistocephalus solidus]|uniref:Reverse transcriptase domain-containing protein n=1 Tax=Schistocephalus solidus TaxID=70667 RepID=A0A183TQ13_SCHSO|nr:unnamed protein product [Schistocephalus solidus]